VSSQEVSPSQVPQVFIYRLGKTLEEITKAGLILDGVAKMINLHKMTGVTTFELCHVEGCKKFHLMPITTLSEADTMGSFLQSVYLILGQGLFTEAESLPGCIIGQVSKKTVLGLSSGTLIRSVLSARIVSRLPGDWTPSKMGVPVRELESGTDRIKNGFRKNQYHITSDGMRESDVATYGVVVSRVDGRNQLSVLF
jgi:hypothetical protein